jgi:2,6-dihydroxypseudooxynicotine hydrolase
MATTKLDAILNPGRMLADGIPFADYTKARHLDDVSQWFGFWTDTANRYEEMGEAALADGRFISAGELLWHASLSFHYAQFLWFHEPELRESGQRSKSDMYLRAAPYLEPAAERIDVAFEGTSIPAYLRLPPGEGPHPCVVLLGGLESTKEESYRFENLCLRRGIATFAFDGPGQGEMFFDLKIQPDFERYTSAVVDYLAVRTEVDSTRLGVLGRSVGGHYAIRSAALDPRFRVCVAWGAFVDMSDWDGMPPHIRDGFVYLSGLGGRDEADGYLREALDIGDIIGNLECPTYILQGANDRIFSTHQTELLKAATADQALTRLIVERDGDHCCHNLAHIVRPRMADWLARHLGAEPETANGHTS